MPAVLTAHLDGEMLLPRSVCAMADESAHDSNDAFATDLTALRMLPKIGTN